jgi:hypothetical protein
MKLVEIVCKKSGRALLSTNDVHVAGENLATTLMFDFSELDEVYDDYLKWVDLFMADGTELRYLIEEDEVLLDSSVMIPGVLNIVPFITESEEPDSVLIKFLTTGGDIVIKEVSITGDPATSRDDYIFELKQRIDIIDGGDF